VNRSGNPDPRYRTQRWRRLRHQALERDGWRCTWPGCGAPLHAPLAGVADHIDEVSDGGPFWDLNNLQSLCRDHHWAKTAHTRTTRSATATRSPNA
jgi:5-methylcytosine-specific restriction endonuclease McrA